MGELVLVSAYLVGAENQKLVLNVLDVLGIALGTVLCFWAYRRFVFPTSAVPLDAAAHQTTVPVLTSSGVSAGQSAGGQQRQRR